MHYTYCTSLKATPILIALAFFASPAPMRAQCVPGGELTITNLTSCPDTQDSVKVKVSGYFGNLCFSPLQFDSSRVAPDELWIYTTELHAGYQGCFMAFMEYQFEVTFPTLPSGTHPVRLEVNLIPATDSSEFEGVYYCSSNVVIYSAGDLTLDGALSLADVIGLVNHVFKGSASPACGIADVNCDQVPTTADVLYLINHMLRSGPPPPASCS